MKQLFDHVTLNSITLDRVEIIGITVERVTKIIDNSPLTPLLEYNR